MTDQPGPAAAPEQDLRAQAVAGVFWTAIQQWAVRLSSFLGFLALGRLLSPRDFGVVALAATFIVLMTTLADTGFATYLVQVEDLTAEAKSTAFWIATGSGVLLFGVGCAVAYPLAALLDVPELRRVLPVLAVSMVFVGLSSVPVAVLTREMQFQALAMRQVTATVASVVVGVSLALAGAGPWALVGQFLVLRLVTTIVLALVTELRPKGGFSRSEARKMLSYSGKAMGAHMLFHLRDQGEVLLIGAIAGPVALGIWTVASRLVIVVGDLLGTVIGSVAAPLFARVQSDGARLGRAISATAGMGTLILAPALVLLALLSHELVPHVFGSQWKAATGVAAFLALRGIFVALSQLDRSVLLNAGKAGGELRLIAVLTVVHVGLVAALASQGVEVLALGLLVEAVLVGPIRPLLLRRWLGVSLGSYQGALTVLVAAAVAGALVAVGLRLLDADGAVVYPVVLLIGGIAYPLLVLVLARPVVRETLATLQLFRRRRGASASAEQPVDDASGRAPVVPRAEGRSEL
jgi:O-antigen/teichoic acid export membrane protein